MLNILATITICMGLANVSPFNNVEEKTAHTIQPKKANIETNYEININLTNYQETFDFTATQTGNTYYPSTTRIINRKWNMQANNSYINVLGSIYANLYQVNATDEDNQQITPMMIENKDKIGNNLDYLYRNRTEMVYIYKLTPYNYNVNTEMEIRTVIQLTEWTNQNDIDWFIYESYFIRNIYIQTEPTQNKDLSRTWDRYINQQTTTAQAYDICRDIENVDNGFYYTKTQNLLQIGYNTVPYNTYNDEITLSITPEVDNYIVIEYIPCARAVEMGDGQRDELMIPLKGALGPYNTGQKITGTNIIPDGTYEVVNIPGLMFDVLTMPFAFVSQAFNLTIFPGTPYQINIANLFLSIIAILVFVWLMKKFTKL